MNEPFAMIIEDDYDLSNIFTRALQAAGFQTQTYQAGDTALAKLSTATPDVVVLDLHLPHVSGTEILEQIRGEPRMAGTRVIIVTADEQMAETLREEADLVLVKPVSFSQLRDLATRLK